MYWQNINGICFYYFLPHFSKLKLWMGNHTQVWQTIFCSNLSEPLQIWVLTLSVLSLSRQLSSAHCGCNVDLDFLFSGTNDFRLGMLVLVRKGSSWGIWIFGIIVMIQITSTIVVISTERINFWMMHVEKTIVTNQQHEETCWLSLFFLQLISFPHCSLSTIWA